MIIERVSYNNFSVHNKFRRKAWEMSGKNKIVPIKKN